MFRGNKYVFCREHANWRTEGRKQFIRWFSCCGYLTLTGDRQTAVSGSSFLLKPSETVASHVTCLLGVLQPFGPLTSPSWWNPPGPSTHRGFRQVSVCGVFGSACESAVWVQAELNGDKNPSGGVTAPTETQLAPGRNIPHIPGIRQVQHLSSTWHQWLLQTLIFTHLHFRKPVFIFRKLCFSLMKRQKPSFFTFY